MKSAVQIARMCGFEIAQFQKVQWCEQGAKELFLPPNFYFCSASLVIQVSLLLEAAKGTTRFQCTAGDSIPAEVY